jgi:acetyltransferase-like isoleucine patch superfamily enzyme
MVQFLSTIWSRLRLWRCAEVGQSPSLLGHAWVHGSGAIRIGNRVRIDGRQAPVELHAGPGAELVIGDDVVIRAGTSIEARHSVTIGDRTCIDGFARIMDNHMHAVVGDRRTPPASLRVEVGPDARIEWKAILLPGARVAQGRVVPPGSVVRASKGQPAEPATLTPGAGARARRGLR